MSFAAKVFNGWFFKEYLGMHLRENFPMLRIFSSPLSGIVPYDYPDSVQIFDCYLCSPNRELNWEFRLASPDVPQKSLSHSRSADLGLYVKTARKAWEKKEFAAHYISHPFVNTRRIWIWDASVKEIPNQKKRRLIAIYGSDTLLRSFLKLWTLNVDFSRCLYFSYILNFHQSRTQFLHDRNIVCSFYKKPLFVYTFREETVVPWFIMQPA